MFVLDSSALIEAIEGGSILPKLVKLLGDSPLITTSICMHEVLLGAKTEKDHFVFEGIFSALRILEHDSRAAKLGAKIQTELTKTGNTIGTTDCLIAGICKANNAELITLDKDFTRIKDFKVHFLK